MAVRDLMMATVMVAAAIGPARADDAAAARAPIKVLGLTESVVILPEDIEVHAKVDTGAENSSIDTQEWETFERDGETWVRFVLRLDDERRETLERPLKRMVGIRRAGGRQVRPIIVMTLCVGDTLRKVEVNLAERGRLSFRMLLGASFLSGAFLVDVSQSYTRRPACGGAQR